MKPDLASALADLDGTEQELLDMGMRLLKAYDGALYPLDLLANAALKRAMSLNSGFTTLLRADNFLAAAHLVRLQLDTVLRLSAAWIVQNCHDFAGEVLKGVSIRDMKDRLGKRMTDAYLVSILSKEHSWISRVYEETSGYIHLSDKHIFNTLSPSDKPQSITIEISSKSGPVSEEIKVEAALAMRAITNLLLHYLHGWCATKENPPEKTS